MNLHRRHLTASQRGMIGARLATLKRGDVASQKDGAGIPALCLARDDAAHLLNISADSIDDAKAVLRAVPPDQIKAVATG